MKVVNGQKSLSYSASFRYIFNYKINHSRNGKPRLKFLNTEYKDIGRRLVSYLHTITGINFRHMRNIINNLRLLYEYLSQQSYPPEIYINEK